MLPIVFTSERENALCPNCIAGGQGEAKIGVLNFVTPYLQDRNI
jgi:hypothetical protein